ncbi:hypothetical protein DUNSADRAFT_12843 [Dunaliella salina]|uniref:Ionotropic glutamate receptor C-terminal domain-containing protein n=1 Tax=Dunaliella salina TaxID=3046 RepID=A0ABQ7H9R1_DUNSA|nr:hypothetical protein DUNSADRAFT_12843 [Dunaliella salina]|eukprot:KAF5843582.1 hypothetical protein DUNSADRAFT_12843 [Dunaliella salina]
MMRVSAFLLAWACLTACRAQDLLEPYVMGVKRDWCALQQVATASGVNNTQLALAGRKIVCGAVNYPPFSVQDEETGEWSGFDIELFAKVARRGQFEYEIIRMEDPPAGLTYDYILFGKGREMDLMCSWWGETAARKRRGMDFSIPTMDTSFILTTPMPKKAEVPFKDQFWTFLSPFSRDLWLVLLFGLVFTAIFLYIADPKIVDEYEHHFLPEEERPTEPSTVYGHCMHAFNGISELFYQGWVLCTIGDNFKIPSNWASRLYLMSWSGVVVVLIASYTAELTAYLVIELQSLSSINNIDDLMRSGKPACAMTGVSFVNTFLKNSAPGLPVVSIANIDEAFPAVRDGKCAAALLGKSEVEVMIAGNKLCDMRMVGSTLNFLSGAFAADVSKCGQYPLRVVDAILQGIREEGVMDDMWEDFTTKPETCVGSKDEEVEDKGLNLKAVGGVWVIHAAFAFVATIILCIRKYRHHVRRPSSQMEAQDESFKLRSTIGKWKNLLRGDRYSTELSESIPE